MALFGSSPNVERHPVTHWVCFRGSSTVTIFASGNMTSINDLGTGHYRINFATSMPDTSYAVSGNTLKGDTNNDGNQHVQFGGCNASSDIGTGSIEARCKVASNNGSNDPNVVHAIFTR
tara:strand:+ start:90 stop:446 length:357 start_codon:yes stop_codon:yes gene_type:complete